MTDSIRIRASLENGVTRVQAIIRHPMEAGYGIEEGTGGRRPQHFIRELICRHGEDVVLRCDWSRAVSKNPYLSFSFTGANAGESFSISWKDNQEKSDAATVVIEGPAGS
ncbi:MAG: thiosulfate oxidation carrier complex protein SoxZ [Gammaproteobacteria bacterium]|nr:thiosulfate oxidation carrier complex protein SoxZ [Gammaproteobacteria bacterium]